MKQLFCILSLDGPSGAAIRRDAGEIREDKVYLLTDPREAVTA